MRLALLFPVIAAALVGASARSAGAATVFAASSLTEVVQALAEAFTAAGGETVTVVTAASSTLARQIEARAPAGVFISASREWTDHVVARAGYGAPVRFAGNALVVIGPAGAPLHIDLPLLPNAVGDGRLALGDPEHVPAGIYARQALENAGLWEALADRIAPADSVRAAVALVASRTAPFGIVYATDARFPGVAAVLAIDPALHAPVSYWMAVAPGATQGESAFAAFVFTPEARAIVAAQGFAP